MKRTFFTIAVAFLFAACQSDENFVPETHLSGTWELVEILPHWPIEGITATDFSYSETYDLRADGTFTKFNSEFGVELTGTYEDITAAYELHPDLAKLLVLTFDMEVLQEILESDDWDDRIITNEDPFFPIVYGLGGKESLSLRKDGYINNSGYGFEDGSVYVYRKK